MTTTLQFFSYISSLTQTKKNEINIDEYIKTVTELVICDAKMHIEKAALTGRESAIIFGYEISSYYEKIPLHKYLFPTAEFENTIHDKSLRTPRECINEAMFPFALTYLEYPVNNTVYILIYAEWRVK